MFDNSFCNLQEAQLEYYYQQTNQEIDDDFEITNLDGIDEV